MLAVNHWFDCKSSQLNYSTVESWNVTFHMIPWTQIIGIIHKLHQFLANKICNFVALFLNCDTFPASKYCLVIRLVWNSLHWENYVFNSFHSEWDMIVVTVFFSILNQMDFHLVQNRKENCHHDHIPFNVKGNGNIVFSV